MEIGEKDGSEECSFDRLKNVGTKRVEQIIWIFITCLEGNCLL